MFFCIGWYLLGLVSMIIALFICYTKGFDIKEALKEFTIKDFLIILFIPWAGPMLAIFLLFFILFVIFSKLNKILNIRIIDLFKRKVK